MFIVLGFVIVINFLCSILSLYWRYIIGYMLDMKHRPNLLINVIKWAFRWECCCRYNWCSPRYINAFGCKSFERGFLSYHNFFHGFLNAQIANLYTSEVCPSQLGLSTGWNHCCKVLPCSGQFKITYLLYFRISIQNATINMSSAKTTCSMLKWIIVSSCDDY